MKKVWGLIYWTKDWTSCFLAYTPLLIDGNITVTQVDVKADLLAKTFFPLLLDANLSNINSYAYPILLSMLDIMLEEVKQTINCTKPNKASGPDNISNFIFYLTKQEFNTYLYIIFNACLQVGYYPRHFWESKIVAL